MVSTKTLEKVKSLAVATTQLLFVRFTESST